MTPNLEQTINRTQANLGARVGRLVSHGGVITTSRALAMSPENLALLEAAWRFDAAGRSNGPRS